MQESKRALSLIEVCISIVIVAMVLASMVGIFSQGYRYLRKARMKTTAYFLAQEKMEELSTDSDATLFSAPDSHDEARGVVDATLFPGFEREVDVTCPYDPCVPPASCPYPNLAQITVIVYWQGEQGEQSFRLVSLVANF